MLFLGDRKHVDWFRERIKEEHPVKIRGSLSPRDIDEKQISILNRIVTLRNAGIEYEADQRHALGVKNDREVSSPAEKGIGEKKPTKLGGSDATKYKAMVARMNYLGQDRTDIANSVKELCKTWSHLILTAWPGRD